MKLKIVLTACSLFAAVAHAQTPQVAPQQQAIAQRNDGVAPAKPAVAPANNADECVGPVSFCNIYFGS